MIAWFSILIRLPLLALTLLALPSASIYGADVSIPVETQSWYYAIGGAQPVSPPLNPNPATIPLGAGAAFSLGYSCGKFDVTSSVTNLFSSAASGLKSTIMNAATGAISALPLYIFQRAQPGLYELFQSYATDFEVLFDNAAKHCEAYERDILAGNDPFEDWRQLAKGENWRVQMASTPDAVAAKQTVETQNGDLGLSWVGGAKAAGAGQPPIEPVRDVTEAGWNLALNRPPDATGPYTGAPVRLSELFPTKTHAGDYAVEALGDLRVSTCDGCTRQSIPGHGLLPKYDLIRQGVATDLTALLGATTVPTYAELQAVSAPGVGISATIIETLRQLPRDEQAILAARLAYEVGVARTLEQALAIRRLLLAGKRVPEVASYTAATEAVDQAVTELEREIDGFLYEQRVRKEITTNTAGAVIARANQIQGAGTATARLPRPEGVHLDEGGRFQ